MSNESESNAGLGPHDPITTETPAEPIGGKDPVNTSSNRKQDADKNQGSSESALGTSEDSITSSAPITPRTTAVTTNGSTSTPGEEAAVVTPDARNKMQNSKSEESTSDTADDERNPDAVKLKFIFANRDGLTVIVSCKLTDSIAEVKGFLMSMWPDTLSPCVEGDRIRLICMGKGVLMPDTKSLGACELPVFKTHATPINVSVRPDYITFSSDQKGGMMKGNNATSSSGANGSGNNVRGASQTGVEQGCSCVIS